MKTLSDFYKEVKQTFPNYKNSTIEKIAQIAYKAYLDGNAFDPTTQTKEETETNVEETETNIEETETNVKETETNIEETETIPTKEELVKAKIEQIEQAKEDGTLDVSKFNNKVNRYIERFRNGNRSNSTMDIILLFQI